MSVQAIVAGYQVTFRLDHPNVQRRGRLGSVKVLTNLGTFTLRAYHNIEPFCNDDAFFSFERGLRELVTPDFMEALLDRPVDWVHFRRFNPSQALADRRPKHRYRVGAPA